ncbi:patatin-like phospholipase family protein [Piscirickettsia litoralis]|uniref:PNPLA domain-containing protein n=1 Tax=Piscirickettsia litoralis TaxID=1891921 RepID=A0ABX3A2K3_9GAMM|nr:patatin-like phospholipase family protein [Piscirickettsia litoralis]ODN42457.1 hypothetical protein BGC07_05315 [Piscirickettsia litoralis]
MPYKYIAFMGGGARGVVYPGGYKALVDSGLYKGIEGISGCSIGAISSAIIASGSTPEQFREISSKTNFSLLLGSRSRKTLLSGADGKPLLNFLREVIKNNILSFFEGKNIFDIKDIGKSFTQNKKELETIFYKCKQNKSITFKDLYILHKVAPYRFKNLSVNAVRKDTGESKIFNYKNTPDVEVSIACLASGALPGVIRPVKINGYEYVDGGLHDNLPSAPKYFKTHKKDQVKKSEILLMTLSRKEGPMYKALHSTPTSGDSLYSPSRKDELKQYGIEHLGINLDYKVTDRKKSMYNKVRLNNSNAIELDITGISTTDFKSTNKRKDEYFYRGYFNTYDSLIKKRICKKPDNNYDLRKFF